MQPIKEEDHNNLDNKHINNDSSISSNNYDNTILLEVKVEKNDINKNIFFYVKKIKARNIRRH